MWDRRNVLRLPIRRTTFPLFAGYYDMRYIKITIILLGFASCTESPSIPPTPAGFIACTGHIHYIFLSISPDRAIWYAFWQESADSSQATLIVATDANDVSTINLRRNDTVPTTNGDTLTWEDGSFSASVQASSDSVIVGTHGVDDGTAYYLRKQ
jgi:hypothetical protein